MCAEILLAKPTVDPWRSPFAAPKTPDDAQRLDDRPMLACSAGSIVRTTGGACRMDTLEPGALLVTRKGTLACVRRIDTHHLTRGDLLNRPDLAPIRFDPGTFPDQTSDMAVLLSRDCPVYTTPDPDTALGACFPASAYCNGATVRHVIPDDGITYVRLHLSEPAEICVCGVWVQTEGASARPAGQPVIAASRYSDLRVFTPLKN